jgi:hypothetical protein
MPGTKKRPRSDVMMRTSKASPSMAPAAQKWPLICATVGTGRVSRRARRSSASCCRSFAEDWCCAIHCRSMPLLKNRPSPVTITQDTASSASAASSALLSADKSGGFRRCSPMRVPQLNAATSSPSPPASAPPCSMVTRATRASSMSTRTNSSKLTDRAAANMEARWRGPVACGASGPS